MAEARFSRLQKAATLVPLALLSAAWSLSIAGVGLTGSTATSAENTLPDGTSVPEEAIEAPASVSTPGSLAPGVKGDVQDAVRTASANGIPSAALTAYQRAESIINAADTSCHLPWQLIAAIGRVESDHGRTNGNSLDNNGLARPGIYGIALNGKQGTSLISDTDAGLVDNDEKFDRAVGPMQFIPSTWSTVGVDADGDSERNPQDIDDAALATAVYLCSGKDDLSGDEGQRAAVFRYNHSQEYVDLVMAFYQAYVSGDYTSVPNQSTGGGFIVPGGGGGNGGGGGGGGEPTASPVPTKQPTSKPTPTTKPTPTSSSTPTTQPSSQPTQTQQPSPDPTKLPTKDPTTALPTSVPTSLPTLLPTELPTTILTPILDLAEAIVQCTAQGLIDNPLNNNDAFDQCVAGLTGG